MNHNNKIIVTPTKKLLSKKNNSNDYTPQRNNKAVNMFLSPTSNRACLIFITVLAIALAMLQLFHASLLILSQTGNSNSEQKFYDQPQKQSNKNDDNNNNDNNELIQNGNIAYALRLLQKQQPSLSLLSGGSSPTEQSPTICSNTTTVDTDSNQNKKDPTTSTSTTNTISSSSILYPAADESLKEGFSACMIIMDDNHYLIEWLAYHYYFLPLRRLFVTIDPKSITSPMDIFNRYIGRINITIWDDDDYLPKDMKDAINVTNPVKVYLQRQRKFYYKCLKQSQDEGRNWVAIIDTDEYIVVNHYASPDYQIKDFYPTMYEMLESPINRNISEHLNSSCVPMHRLRVGAAEDDDFEQVKEQRRQNLKAIKSPMTNQSLYDIMKIPPGFNVTNFITYRFRYTDSRETLAPPKNVMDVSRTGKLKANLQAMSPHRPQRHLCPKSNMQLKNRHSAFVTNHYTGSFEQFSYREDGRGNRGWKEYNKQKKYKYERDDFGPTSWLEQFVNHVGLPTAQRLLEGAGTVDLRFKYENAISKIVNETNNNNNDTVVMETTAEKGQ